MSRLHTGLTDERWRSFSLVAQLAAVGSEIESSMAAALERERARAS